MNKEALIKRLQSFLWRAGMMALAMAVDFLLQSLADFNLPPATTVLLGMVLGEVSKYLNSKETEKPLG